MKRYVILLTAGLVSFVGILFAVQPPQTGPATEKRFPPLKVPAGFKATLFACDPLIEYPSVMSIGPKPGSIFLAHDYVTGLGYEIVRRSGRAEGPAHRSRMDAREGARSPSRGERRRRRPRRLALPRAGRPRLRRR